MVISDTLLLNLLSKRDNYERFGSFVKEHAVAKDSWEVLKSIKAYFSTYPAATEVKWDEFTEFHFLVNGKLKEDKATAARNLISACADKQKELAASTEPNPVLEEIVGHYVKLDYATRILNHAASIATGADKALTIDKDILDLVQDYAKEVGRAVKPDDLFVSTSLSEVVGLISAPGFEWHLEDLNVSLGPIRDGDFIIVAARPETGKTTFCAHAVEHFARQLKDESRPIIWVNNEERSKKVFGRVQQAYFGVTTEELMKNAARYEAEYTRDVGRRILVLDDAAGINSVSKLSRIFKEYGPSLIVFDQLDKVHGFDKEAREDLKIGKLYEWARDMSKVQNCPVIAVSQVDGTGEGQKWLNMNQLRGSKTDKAGEADAIITIGKDSDPKNENQRYIHVPKNQLFGGPRTQEAYRHGYFEVQIMPSIARYKSNMKGGA